MKQDIQFRRAGALLLDASAAGLGVLGLSTAYGVFYGYPLAGLSEPLFGLRVLWAWVLVPLETVPATFWLALASGLLPAFLLVGLNPLRQPPRGHHGDARFASNKEIKQMGLFAKRGLILGKVGRRIVRTAQPLSALILAPPGTGKSAGIVVPNLLLERERSFMVLDVKGELYDLTAKHRAGFSKVLRFAPGQEDTVGWNPFVRIPDDFGGRAVLARRIAKILIRGEKEGDYWTLAAQELFAFAAQALMHRDDVTSLPAVYSALIQGRDRRKNIIALAGAESPFGDALPSDLRSYGLGVATYADAQFDGLFGTLETHLGVFADPSLQGAFVRSDFDFDLLGREFTTVYVCVRDRDIERLGGVIRLFFEFAASELSVRAEAAEGKKLLPITLLLDEFVRLGKLEQVRDLPALSRGAGVNVVLLAQDWGQIRTRYGADGASAIEGTMAYLLVLTQVNHDSAERISKRMGEQTRSRYSISLGQNNKDNISVSSEGKRLVLPQELLALPFGHAFLLAQFAGERPLKMEIPLWFKSRQMKRLASG